MADTADHGSSPVRLSGGAPETVLPPEPDRVGEELAAALAGPASARWAAVAAAVRASPRSLAGWDALGRLADDDLVAYACFRVGYHRGLDALRGAGWRGSGYVRWAEPANRPFLSCLDGLRGAAAAIGERDEEQRCAQFLRQLDPSWPPAGTSASGRA